MLKTSKEWLKYEFSDEEKNELAKEMAEANEREQGLEREKTEVVAELKGRIEAAKAERLKCAGLYRTGYEYRNIECDVRYDYDKCTVEYWRTDTGELAKTRKMTPEEKQPELNV